jgi:hypothetical protein
VRKDLKLQQHSTKGLNNITTTMKYTRTIILLIIIQVIAIIIASATTTTTENIDDDKSNIAGSLPEPSSNNNPIQHQTIKFDQLGPIIINHDGTMRRIANWDKMTEKEQTGILKMLQKRNKQRMDVLKADEEENNEKECIDDGMNDNKQTV